MRFFEPGASTPIRLLVQQIKLIALLPYFPMGDLLWPMT
jgi:hypothetical protein